MGKNKNKKTSKIHQIEVDKKIKYVMPIDEFDIQFLQLNYNKYRVRNNDDVVPVWSVQRNTFDNNYYEFEIFAGSDENGVSNSSCKMPIEVSNDIANINTVKKLNETDDEIDFTTYLKLVNVFKEADTTIGSATDQKSLIDNVVIDQEPSVKLVDYNKTVASETVSTDPLVTLCVPSGEKLKVAMNNFHGFWTSRYGVQCRVCMVMVEDVEAHKMKIRHMKRIAYTIKNVHCIREIGPILNHCVLCNEIIENIEFHLKTNADHIKNLEQALKLSTKHQLKPKISTVVDNTVESNLLSKPKIPNFNNDQSTRSSNQIVVNKLEIQNIERGSLIDKLMKKVENSNKPILTNHPKVTADKHPLVNNDDTNDAFCNVCDRKMHSNQLKSHVEGKAHMAHLLKIKHKEIKEVSEKFDLPSVIATKNKIANKYQPIENSVSNQTVVHNFDIPKQKEKTNVVAKGTDNKHKTISNTAKINKLKYLMKEIKNNYNLIECRVCRVTVPSSCKNAVEHIYGGKHVKEYDFLMKCNKIKIVNEQILFCEACKVYLNFASELNHIQTKHHKNFMNYKNDVENEMAESRTITVANDHSSSFRQEEESDVKTKSSGTNSLKNANATLESYDFNSNYSLRNSKNTKQISNPVSNEICQEGNRTNFQVCNNSFRENRDDRVTFKNIKNELKTEAEAKGYDQNCSSSSNQQSSSAVPLDLENKKPLVKCTKCATITYSYNSFIKIKECCITAIFYKQCLTFVDSNRIFCRYCSDYFYEFGIKDIFNHINTAKHLWYIEKKSVRNNTLGHQMEFYFEGTLLCHVCGEFVENSAYRVKLHLKSVSHGINYDKMLMYNQITYVDNDVLYCGLCNKGFTKLLEIIHINCSGHKSMLERSENCKAKCKTNSFLSLSYCSAVLPILAISICCFVWSNWRSKFSTDFYFS